MRKTRPSRIFSIWVCASNRGQNPKWLYCAAGCCRISSKTSTGRAETLKWPCSATARSPKWATHQLSSLDGLHSPKWWHPKLKPMWMGHDGPWWTQWSKICQSSVVLAKVANIWGCEPCPCHIPALVLSPGLGGSPWPLMTAIHAETKCRMASLEVPGGLVTIKVKFGPYSQPHLKLWSSPVMNQGCGYNYTIKCFVV
jgi:hypothetical protein